VGLKGGSTATSFAPDKKDFARIKRKARSQKLTRIGNVHTHVVIGSYDCCIDEKEIKNQLRPSDTDLKYARKFNDIIRAVIVVYYPRVGEKGKIRGIIWFDQYGSKLNVR